MRSDINYLIDCSEDRLTRVKRGEGLQKTAISQSHLFSQSKLSKLPYKTRKKYSEALKLLEKFQTLEKTQTSQSQAALPQNKSSLAQVSILNDEPSLSKEIKEAGKLANLSKFFIGKISEITSKLKENEQIRPDFIHRRNDSLEKMKGFTRKSSIHIHDETSNSRPRKQPLFITETEKKMLEIDKEIQEKIEVNRNFERKLTFFQNLKNQVDEVKEDKKVQSKVKALMRIDPVYLIFYKKKNFGQDSGHGRSMSLGKFSPVKPSSNKSPQKPEGLKSYPKPLKTPSLDSKNFTKITQNSLKEFKIIEKNLRSVFKK